jgi:hypothetical protein
MTHLYCRVYWKRWSFRTRCCGNINKYFPINSFYLWRIHEDRNIKGKLHYFEYSYWKRLSLKYNEGLALCTTWKRIAAALPGSALPRPGSTLPGRGGHYLAVACGYLTPPIWPLCLVADRPADVVASRCPFWLGSLLCGPMLPVGLLRAGLPPPLPAPPIHRSPSCSCIFFEETRGVFPLLLVGCSRYRNFVAGLFWGHLCTAHGRAHLSSIPCDYIYVVHHHCGLLVFMSAWVATLLRVVLGSRVLWAKALGRRLPMPRTAHPRS